MTLMSRARHAGYLPGLRGAAARWLRAVTPEAVFARSGKSAGRFRLYALHVEMAGLRRDGGSMPTAIGLPGKLGRGRPQPGRIPRAGGGFPAPGIPRPHGGCVRPGRPTAGHYRNGLSGRCRPGAFADTGSVQQCAVAEGSTGTARIIRAAGLSKPRLRGTRRGQDGCDHRRSAAAAYAPGRRTTGTGVLDRRLSRKVCACC